MTRPFLRLRPAPLARSCWQGARVVERCLIWTVAVLVRLLACTWRYRVHGMDRLVAARTAGKRPVVLLLHGRLACLVPYSGRPGQRPYATMVSRSRDGERITALLSVFGFRAVRGSAHRGGARALVDALRAIREAPTVPMCFTVDGSRGPRGHLKPGAILPALRLGAPLFLVAAAPSRAFIVPSWDRLCLPQPWATVIFYVSPGLYLSGARDAASVERCRSSLEDLLIHMHVVCARLVGYHDREPIRIDTT